MPQQRPDLAIGDSIDRIDTPALILDLDIFDANLRAMSGFARTRGLRLRPHAKTHKSAEIARQQIAAGAVGICCQKVGEAIALVEGGVGDVLVTNEVLAADRLSRLAGLTGRATIGICLDSDLGLDRLNEAAATAARRIDAYVELEVGANRCGLVEIGDAVALAEKIHASNNLRFAGIQAYQGAAQHLRVRAERKAAIDFAAFRAATLVAALNEKGITVPVVTGGGTGTFPLEAASGVYNEIQPGSYVFMDRDYGDNQADPDSPVFRQSLFVLAGIMSRREDFAVIDAGLKAHSIDSGFPTIAGRPDLVFDTPSDEHGIIRGPRQALPALEQRLRLVPGHCDPTVNLYDWIIGLREDKVAAIWPVDARGALN